MATRNSTGDRLARAVLRLNNRSHLALYQTRAALKSATHCLATDSRLYLTFAALSILAFALALPAIKANPQHPFHRTLAYAGVTRG